LKKNTQTKVFFLNNPAAIYNQIIKWRKIGRKDYLYHLKKTAFKRRCEYKRMLCFVFNETRNTTECLELSRLFFTCCSKNKRKRIRHKASLN